MLRQFTATWYFYGSYSLCYHLGMKKRRGIKRYYKKLLQCNEWDYWSEYLLDPSAWCNYAHQHFDWPGYGDICWKERKVHLEILFKHFSIIGDRLKNRERPFQMFAILHWRDSGQDALYFHTPNPYSDFPYNAIKEGYTIGIVSKNDILVEYLRNLEKQGYTILTYVGESDYQGSFLVFKKNVGESLIMENDNKQQTS